MLRSIKIKPSYNIVLYYVFISFIYYGGLPTAMNAVLAIIANSGRAINHVALFITLACSNQMYLNTISTLGDQWELKVGRLVSLKGLIEHSLDRSLEIVGDEILDQRLSGDLLGAVTIS